jgi:hypothetical protein
MVFGIAMFRIELRYADFAHSHQTRAGFNPLQYCDRGICRSINPDIDLYGREQERLRCIFSTRFSTRSIFDSPIDARKRDYRLEIEPLNGL